MYLDDTSIFASEGTQTEAHSKSRQEFSPREKVYKRKTFNLILQHERLASLPRLQEHVINKLPARNFSELVVEATDWNFTKDIAKYSGAEQNI